MKELGPKKLQGAQTRAKIQDAATRLFVSQGFTRTPISEIAGSLGRTKGALYAHFASKEELLLSLIERFETDYLDRVIDEVVSTEGNAWAKLNRFVSFSSEFAEKNKDLCLLLTIVSAELQGAETPASLALFHAYDKYTEFVARLVDEGKGQGVFESSLDTDLVAHVIIAFHDGVLFQWQRTGGRLGGPPFVKTFRRVLLRGLAPAPEPSPGGTPPDQA
ncbi:MAG: TetR/AcrR family transcriptional regulator [Deltaproteobacteria bacterium]|nr:TetR/AcrR family transcriptional regulator [Deltaproteobacteria bacterium]